MNESAGRGADARVSRLLKRRSAWRWGMSVVLIGAYFCYGIGGVYLPEAFGRPVAGSSLPLGLALGYAIICASILLSIVYVWAINRIEAEFAGDEHE